MAIFIEMMICISKLGIVAEMRRRQTLQTKNSMFLRLIEFMDINRVLAIPKKARERENDIYLSYNLILKYDRQRLPDRISKG